LFVDTGTRRRLSVTYRDEGSSSRGKPQGIHSIEVRWEIEREGEKGPLGDIEEAITPRVLGVLP
jgi:hypothetical protein